MKGILDKIEKLTLEHDNISPDLISKKNIKLGLRNSDGSGVIVGITTKGRVIGYEKRESPDGSIQLKTCPGKLFYCNYDVEKIIKDIVAKERFGFEEVVYLLLSGELPSESDLNDFEKALAKKRFLSKMERNIIMEEVQNDNQMYGLHSVTSHLARCDANPDSIDIKDVSRQCLSLIAKFPTIVAYNYNFTKFRNGADLKMLRPRAEYSTAENFLYMLRGERPDPFESHLFDIALILHAEHGGGNNSTFALRTVSSSGANTYMAIAAGIASLSGHLHGGANEAVMRMMKSLKKSIPDWNNELSIKTYLMDLMEKRAGDGTGKIYGLGHPVYTVSDPRAIIFKEYAAKIAKIKGAQEEYKFYDRVDKIASDLLSKKYNKPISTNVDFYSGFIYKLMGIPKELFTPIFAMARVAGWSAHRIEQIIQGKLIRPAYVSAKNSEEEYIPIENRK